MPSPSNRFPSALEDAFLTLLASADAALPSAAKANLAPSKSEDPNKYPRVVVIVESGEEAVYQSGIYKCPLKIRCHTDIDAGDRVSAEDLSARVLDVVQWV